MVARKKHIEKNARVAAQTASGPLIEIEFKGKAWDGCGEELFKYVGGVVRDMSPAGVLLNLKNYKIISWDDIGPVVGQLFDKQTRALLPFCYVAQGKTAKSLKTMTMAMQFSELTEVFEDDGEGLEYLQERIRRTTPDGPPP